MSDSGYPGETEREDEFEDVVIINESSEIDRFMQADSPGQLPRRASNLSMNSSFHSTISNVTPAHHGSSATQLSPMPQYSNNQGSRHTFEVSTSYRSWEDARERFTDDTYPTTNTYYKTGSLRGKKFGSYASTSNVLAGTLLHSPRNSSFPNRQRRVQSDLGFRGSLLQNPKLRRNQSWTNFVASSKAPITQDISQKEVTDLGNSFASKKLSVHNHSNPRIQRILTESF